MQIGFECLKCHKKVRTYNVDHDVVVRCEECDRHMEIIDEVED